MEYKYSSLVIVVIRLKILVSFRQLPTIGNGQIKSGRFCCLQIPPAVPGDHCLLKGAGYLFRLPSHSPAPAPANSIALPVSHGSRGLTPKDCVCGCSASALVCVSAGVSLSGSTKSGCDPSGVAEGGVLVCGLGDAPGTAEATGASFSPPVLPDGTYMICGVHCACGSAGCGIVCAVREEPPPPVAFASTRTAMFCDNSLP